MGFSEALGSAESEFLGEDNELTHVTVNSMGAHGEYPSLEYDV